MKTFQRILPWILAATAASLLAGCFGVAAVGAGTGALMATDRRLVEAYMADEAIENRVLGRVSDKYGDRVHVNVTSYNRDVLLTGEAPDAATKAGVEQIARGVDGVKGTINEIEIGGISSYASRSNDTWITSKVKAGFVDAKGFSANHVKVVTENSVVYLRGIVTQSEANAAVNIARNVGGVKKVVRVFEIVSEAKARELDGSASRKNEAQ